jgi:hypothetical protein
MEKIKKTLILPCKMVIKIGYFFASSPLDIILEINQLKETDEAV